MFPIKRYRICITLKILASADAVFAEIFSRILESINFETVFGTLFMTIVVFFCSCIGVSRHIAKRAEQTADRRTDRLETGSKIFGQIPVLGNMRLPEGYTYSSYAREGFFQLLTVCILNLIIVLL